MNRHPTRSVAGFAVAAIVAGTFAASAWANVPAPENQPPHTTVKFGDLNLETREGIDVLYRRIKGAARIVCNQAIDRSDPFHFGLWDRCYNDAVANAVSKVNNAQLTIRHAQSSSRHVG